MTPAHFSLIRRPFPEAQTTLPTWREKLFAAFMGLAFVATAVVLAGSFPL